MSSKAQKDKAKNVQDKYQMILSRLLREEDNKYCADCDAKGPRWASWNLGIFLCIRCAGIHRNLGVHISKVKSVNLDTWTEVQIQSVENGGNTLGRKVYEKHLPAEFRRPTADSSSLEHFIRLKYDSKKYMDKDYVKPAPQKIQSRDFENTDKKEKKNASAARQKQQTLVSIAKSRDAHARPHGGSLAPSMAASLTSTLSQSSPNLVATDQPQVSLSATPVKTVASANDLLGLCTQPTSNVDDLLGLDTPVSTATVGEGATSSNGTPEGTGGETSLFGDSSAEAAAAAAGGTGGEKKTKDSIMALFASSSSSSSSSSAGQQQPAFNVPGGVYIPSQKLQQQPFVANGYQANSMPGYPQQQQQQQQPQMPQQLQANAAAMPGYQPQANNMAAFGVVNNQPPAAMMAPQQGMMGNQQGMMGNQQGMMSNQPPAAMMGNQQGMMGNQQGMMGNQQAMMGNQPPAAMMAPQQGMMGNQQGMMGMPAMYANQAAQQQNAYLQQQQQQPQQQQPAQTQQQQQQFQMMQQQMTQQYRPWEYAHQMQVPQQYQMDYQIQQQMNSMRIGGGGSSGGANPPQAPMQQPGWQQTNAALPQQQAVPSAGWGGAGSGQTLSNQLWK